MNESSRPQPSPIVRWFPRLVTAAAFVFALGFLLHHSPYPVLFGRYNERYLAFLALIFLVGLPLVYFAVRFFVTTHELKGAAGRRIAFGPRQKLLVAVFLGLVGTIVGNWYLGRVLAGNVATHDAHSFHPYLQNVARPNHKEQHVNRWGFKGDDLELKKDPKTFRVFVFGGSTVHCGTVPYEQTHCRVLEKRLRERYPEYQIEVQNLGAEWHCTEHDVIKLLFFAQDFQPDLVVIFHGINDLVRSFETDFFGEGPYRSDYMHYYGAVSNLARPGRTASLFINAAGGHWCSDLRFTQVRLAGPEGNGVNNMLTMFFPKARTVEVENWNSLPAYERNLRDFIEIAATKNMQVLLATQASLYRTDLSEDDQQLLSFPLSHQFHGQKASLRSMTEGMQRYNDVTRQIARDTSVHLVDIEQKMPKTTQYLYDDVHYTKDGNSLIGNAFADDIIAWDIVPTTIATRQAGQ